MSDSITSKYNSNFESVILSERSESKDPETLHVLLTVKSFLSMLFVEKACISIPDIEIVGVLRLALLQNSPRATLRMTTRSK